MLNCFLFKRKSCLLKIFDIDLIASFFALLLRFFASQKKEARRSEEKIEDFQ